MKELELTNGGVTLVDDWFYLDLLALGKWRFNSGYAVSGDTRFAVEFWNGVNWESDSVAVAA